MNIIGLLEEEKEVLVDIMSHPTEKSVERKLDELKQIHVKIFKESCKQVIEKVIEEQLH